MIEVSVIVTTRNEEEHIGQCLESVKNQDFNAKDLEVIVIDNNSSDRTKEIAKQYDAKVFDHGPERSAQRNYGVKQACGKYILYLDADMQLSKTVLSESLQACETKGYCALYIPERIIGKGFWIKVRDFERSFYNATCIDCVRFVRRDKFLEIGGFDEGLTGPEDWDFDRRLRQVCKTDSISSPLYHNEEKFDLLRYICKKAYYAMSFKCYIDKWGKDDPSIKKQFGIWYRYFWVFMENGKWIRSLKRIDLFMGVLLLRFLVGLNYIWSKFTYGRPKI